MGMSVRVRGQEHPGTLMGMVFIGRLEYVVRVVRAYGVQELASQEACHSTAGTIKSKAPKDPHVNTPI